MMRRNPKTRTVGGTVRKTRRATVLRRIGRPLAVHITSQANGGALVTFELRNGDLIEVTAPSTYLAMDWIAMLTHRRLTHNPVKADAYFVNGAQIDGGPMNDKLYNAVAADFAPWAGDPAYDALRAAWQIRTHYQLLLAWWEQLSKWPGGNKTARAAAAVLPRLADGAWKSGSPKRSSRADAARLAMLAIAYASGLDEQAVNTVRDNDERVVALWLGDPWNGFYETALLWEAETSAWRMVVPQRFVNRLED